MRERQSLEDTFLEWNAKIKRRKSNAIELVDRGHEIFDVYGLGQPSGWGPRDTSGEKFHIVCRVSIGDEANTQFKNTSKEPQKVEAWYGTSYFTLSLEAGVQGKSFLSSRATPCCTIATSLPFPQ
jgi:hypothetical protein